MLFQLSLELSHLVLPALVGMQDRFCALRQFIKQSLQHFSRLPKIRAFRNRIAYYFIVVQVYDRRQIYLVSAYGKLRHVGCQLLKWSIG